MCSEGLLTLVKKHVSQAAYHTVKELGKNLFPDLPLNYRNPLAKFKAWHKIKFDDGASGFYQGEVNDDEKGDGRGIAINMAEKYLNIGSWKED